MKRIKLIFILILVGMLLIGCKSKETRVQEQLDLGSKYMAELDYESAIVALNKAIKIDPKNVDAYKMLAEVYEKSGRLDDARATLEKMLDLNDLSSKNKNEINDRIKNLDFLVAISKLPGEYDEPTALELSNIGSNDIYYSIDTEDSRLVATDMKYTSPILLDEDGSYIVKAYTVDSSGNKHDSTEVKYTIKLSKEHSEKDSWESVGNIYRYRGKDGKIVTDWQQIDGSWYYFKENGDMATGVADINGVKYCFDEDGVMLIGWQQIAGKWYYLGDDGIAKSGSQSIDGKQYYFGDDGDMLTGWQQIAGKWYYISDSGELSTGWKEIDGKWYYFASNGEMKTDQYIDGYYVGADGVRTDIVQEPVPPSKNWTDKFLRGEIKGHAFDDEYGPLYAADGGHMYSTGKVIDRGNFYEVQDVTIYGTHDSGFEPYTTTIYVRKNAKVMYQNGNDILAGRTAEDVYKSRGGKIIPEHDYELNLADEDGRIYTFISDLHFDSDYESLDSLGYIVLLTGPSE
ncbi:hypothetical protein LSA36186_07940 [Lachnoanaerobaculum sp. JCM 36186]|uniref:N-acetylmuramoyl-L-alanine amidase family protein n=1 Tax=Lachnoanaerobaculum sanguinis TaxID=3065809 RepID=UPI00274F494B|nr:tetratricopeptide repeat protein [Lachnoanaerobaculum sp. JCM 36186]GMO02545.1 hypothetical protein LSA36186_07940 [Lachnoanaerobaculum sp. JCM 36186]